MRISDRILILLSNHPGNYRQLRSLMLGDLYLEDQIDQNKRRRAEIKALENSFRVTLSRLKKNGLVKNDGHFWETTRQGKEKAKKQGQDKKHPSYPPIPKSDKKIIITFDVPEAERKNRNWLRLQLLHLNFKLLQKSVWLGPAPLPKEFIEDLKYMKLIPHLKFFEVKETDII